jgi:hypothetical protein
VTTRRLPIHKPVIVKWVDAKVFVDPTEKFDLPIMTSIGFILSYTKEKLLLSNLIGTDNDPRIIVGIPSSLVRNVKRLR